MGAGAPALDLVAVRVLLVCIVNDEEKVAACRTPPVGNECVMRLPIFIDVNDNIPILAFSLHDASALLRLQCRAEDLTLHEESLPKAQQGFPA